MARQGRTPVLLGLDVGGTDLKLGIVDLEGTVLWTRKTPMECRKGKKGVIASLQAAAAVLSEHCALEGWQPKSVGIGFPGIIDEGRILLGPPQIPKVTGLPLVEVLEESFGVPADAENDATAATYGEVRCGAGLNSERALMVTVGTALGGGLVLDGRLQRGARGTAGEIGHMIYAPKGRPCPFNGQGCLELYASATGLLRHYQENGGKKGRSAQEIFDEAKAGQRRALAAVDSLAEALGCGLASAANLVAPDTIIVGGGVSAAGSFLLNKVKRSFRTFAIPPVAKGCRLVLARRGNRAGFIGAALLAYEQRLS